MASFDDETTAAGIVARCNFDLDAFYRRTVHVPDGPIRHKAAAGLMVLAIVAETQGGKR